MKMEISFDAKVGELNAKYAIAVEYPNGDEEANVNFMKKILWALKESNELPKEQDGGI